MELNKSRKYQVSFNNSIVQSKCVEIECSVCMHIIIVHTAHQLVDDLYQKITHCQNSMQVQYDDIFSHSLSLSHSLAHSNHLSSHTPALPHSLRLQSSRRLTSSSTSRSWTEALDSITPPLTRRYLRMPWMNKMAASPCLLSTQEAKRNILHHDGFFNQKERRHLIVVMLMKVTHSILLTADCPGHSHRWLMPPPLEALMVTPLQERDSTRCWKATPVQLTTPSHQSQSIG